MRRLRKYLQYFLVILQWKSANLRNSLQTFQNIIQTKMHKLQAREIPYAQVRHDGALHRRDVRGAPGLALRQEESRAQKTGGSSLSYRQLSGVQCGKRGPVPGRLELLKGMLE